MTTENANTPRKTSLLDDFIGEITLEVRADLKDLFATLHGDELLEAVIERLQRYAIAGFDDAEDANFRRYKLPHMLGTIRETISEELAGWISNFISDAHREFIVCCHARGLSTSDAVWTLVHEDETMSRLAQPDVMGTGKLHRELVTRLAYLKPGTARWPERKYGAIWREAREQHKQDIRDIPLTSSGEQVALLAKHADYINEMLDNGNHSVKDFQGLTDSLVKTVEALQKFSSIEQQGTPNVSEAQLIAVLEHLTLALDTPKQFSITGNTQALVGVLERLTIALKSADHTAIAGKVGSVQPDVDDGNSEKRSSVKSPFVLRLSFRCEESKRNRKSRESGDFCLGFLLGVFDRAFPQFPQFPPVLHRGG